MLHMLNTDTDTDTMQNISVSLNTFKDRYTCHTQQEHTLRVDSSVVDIPFTAEMFL